MTQKADGKLQNSIPSQIDWKKHYPSLKEATMGSKKWSFSRL